MEVGGKVSPEVSHFQSKGLPSGLIFVEAFACWLREAYLSLPRPFFGRLQIPRTLANLWAISLASRVAGPPQAARQKGAFILNDKRWEETGAETRKSFSPPGWAGTGNKNPRILIALKDEHSDSQTLNLLSLPSRAPISWHKANKAAKTGSPLPLPFPLPPTSV